MERIGFVAEYRSLARQLATREIAGQWMRLAEQIPTLTAAEAAEWANLGYMPREAEGQIRSGITAAMTAEMERHAEQAAGGPAGLLAERLGDILGRDGWEDGR